MSISIDLNCDLGEYEHLDDAVNDAAIMPFISSCNVACGAHAGNPAVMTKTIEFALANKVRIGAHPSYPDRKNFGRSAMNLSTKQLKQSLVEQINTLGSLVTAQGTTLSHIKPHGALYNQAAVDESLACLLAEITAEFHQNISFYGLANSAMQTACKKLGVNFVAEGFADRAYTAEGLLVARTQAAAVVNDRQLMQQRAITMIKHNTVTSIDGNAVSLKLDSLCLHGDHMDSVQTAQTLNKALRAAGIAILAPQMLS